jgi:glutathione S-transferase
VDHWLQWEAGQLRAAVFAGGDAAAAALAQLDAQLSKGGPFLAGSSITLADVSVLCLLGSGCDVCVHTQLLTALSINSTHYNSIDSTRYTQHRSSSEAARTPDTAS